MLKKKKTEDMESTENTTGFADEQAQDEAAETTAETTSSAEVKLKEELSAANDKYLRLFAEFDNFRRRTSKERVDLLQTAGKEIIVSLLPVMDDFERAFKAMDNTDDAVSVKTGVELIYSKLNNILSQKGLKPMDSVGEPFDADLHEAITNVPAPNEEFKGKVLDEMEKGYYLGDKVVRFAKVIVGN